MARRVNPSLRVARTRRCTLALLCVVGIVSCVLPAGARNQLGATLTLHFHGPDDCADPAQLRAKLDDLVDGDIALDQPLTADVHVVRNGNAFELSLRLNDGKLVSERQWRGQSCDEVVGAAAVAVALALQSRQSEGGLPPSRGQSEGESNGKNDKVDTGDSVRTPVASNAPTNADAGGDRDDASDPSPRLAQNDHRPQFIASLPILGVGTDFSLPSRLGAGLGLGTEWGAWRLHLYALLDLSRQVTSSSFKNTRATIHSAHSTFELCRWLGPGQSKLAPCLLVSGEMLRATGGGEHVEGNTDHATWLAVGPGLIGGLSLGHHATLLAAVGLEAQLLGPSLEVTDQGALATGGLLRVSATLRAEWRF